MLLRPPERRAPKLPASVCRLSGVALVDLCVIERAPPNAPDGVGVTVATFATLF